MPDLAPAVPTTLERRLCPAGGEEVLVVVDPPTRELDGRRVLDARRSAL